MLVQHCENIWDAPGFVELEFQRGGPYDRILTIAHGSISKGKRVFRAVQAIYCEMYCG